MSQWLDSLPQAWRAITVFELLQHASGIADYRDSAGFDPQKMYEPAELVKMVAKTPLAFEPGTDVKLSATNFLLLAQIVEKAAGQSYHDFVTGKPDPVSGVAANDVQGGFSEAGQ